MIGFWLAVIGTWIFTDGLYSLTLYLNAPDYDGNSKQTWRHDHWVRILRMILGVAIIYIGSLLIG